MELTTPVQPASDRFAAIDILRGFALFGILVVNITNFRSGNPAFQGLNRMVDWLILVLFQGKFLALYSFLFGMGFALFMQKNPQLSTVWRYAWRSILLLLWNMPLASNRSGACPNSQDQGRLLRIRNEWIFWTTSPGQFPVA
jgi:uncharacterized membrane protein YeiB